MEETLFSCHSRPKCFMVQLSNLMIAPMESSMTIRTLTFALLAFSCLSLSACSGGMSRSDRAVLGGASGAAVGAVATDRWQGALIGAGVGAAVGAATY